MKLTSIIPLMLASVAFANFPHSHPQRPSQECCISQQEGEQWMQTFIAMFGKTDPNWQQTANALLTDEFVEYSNSDLSLLGQPLGHPGISAPTKASWIQAIASAPPVQGVVTHEIIVACDKLIWFWEFDKVGTGLYPVLGFNLFYMESNEKEGMLRTSKLYLEFDSIAWGLNTGRKVTYPNGTTLPPS